MHPERGLQTSPHSHWETQNPGLISLPTWRRPSFSVWASGWGYSRGGALTCPRKVSGAHGRPRHVCGWLNELPAFPSKTPTQTACFTFRNLGHCLRMPPASNGSHLPRGRLWDHLPAYGDWVEIHLYPGVSQFHRLQKGGPPPHQVQTSLRVRVGGCLNPAPAVSTFVVSPQDIPLHATAPSAPSSTEFMCPVPPGRSVSNCDPHEVADTQVTQPCTSPQVFWCKSERWK